MKLERKDRPLRIIDGFMLLFIGLKLAGSIDWPWLIVLIPLWIDMATTFVVVVNNKIAK